MTTTSNVNYNLYKCFIRVFEERNISKAASILQITQPTVTYNIKELERQLGVRLFHTHPRGVEPTKDAKELYRYVHEGLSSIVNGENNIRDFNEGTVAHITIGVLGQLLSESLAKAIAGFNKIYPKVTFEIADIGTDSSAKLLQHNTDLIIGVSADEHALIGEANLKQANYTAFASKFLTEKYQLSGELSLDDVKKLPLIIFERDKTLLAKLGKPLAIVADLETMKSLVAQDAGVGICLDIQATDNKLDISSLSLPAVSLKAMYNKNTLNKAGKAFLETLCRIFGVIQ
ncbi:MAG: LysR family transcriptional regulator [Firmicutes bacterium]|nr:LysR family transcriptional regulator [Bacillota bacterium]